MVLTMRGRRVLAGAVVAGLTVLGASVHALWPSGRAEAGQAPGTARVASTAAKPSARSTATPARSTPARTTKATRSATAKPSTSRTMTHSGMAGSDRWTTSTVALAAVRPTARTHTYVVKVESTVKGVRADDAARQIQRTLDDSRGWLGSKGAGFAAVADPARAEFVIRIAAPPTVDRLCAPIGTIGTWSCATRGTVILNADRWLHMTPTYDDLGDYRSYMVNHEVGHYLGLGHVSCPRRGAMAPVMMRQSMGLEGCVRNPWPALAD